MSGDAPGPGTPAGAIAPLNASGPVIGGVNPPAGAIASLNAVALEAFLARLYTDEALRRRFLADPHAEIQRAKLGELSAELERIDAVGLELMAESLAAKKRDRGRR